MSETGPRVSVAVVGGGPVGLTAALLLARVGASVSLISPPVGRFTDRRTAALFTGSLTLLGNLGFADQLEQDSTPLSAIRLIDGRGGLLRAPETLFTAAEQGLELFGRNVPNAKLSGLLADAVCAQANVTSIAGTVADITLSANGVLLTLADGQQIVADVVVGADGRNSKVRAAAGIGVRTWDYPQAAVVTTFSHQRPHRGVSTEFHRRHGPLTTVPMPGNASSLVWVDEPGLAKSLHDMPASDFRAALEAELGGLLGGIGDIGERGMFPLSALAADTLGKGRVALVGEAGHVIPPIGAQGLNLGLRDVAELAECLSQGDPVAGIARYAKARAPDVSTRIAAIDGLNRSLLTDFVPIHLLRGAGLFALKSLPALRRVVVQEGLQPSSALPLAMRPGGLQLISQQGA